MRSFMFSSLLFIVFFSLSNAHAFTLVGFSSALKGFSQNPVKIQLDLTACPSGMRDIVDSAVEKLNSIPTSGLKIEIAGESTIASSTVQGYSFTDQIALVCDVNITANYDSSTSLESTFGFAKSQALSNTLYRSYVVINSAAYVGTPTNASFNNPSHSSELKRAVVAHELGHALGLGHSKDTTSLMYFASGEINAFNLHQDDIDGFTYLYSRDEFSDGLLGCGLVNSSNKIPPGLPMATLLFFLLPLLYLAKQRATYRTFIV
jgi:predicted Zn-dependent protease